MSKLFRRRSTGKAASLAFAVVACVLIPASLRGQSAESGVGEVAAFGGGVFGIGAHPVVGGTAGLAFSRYAIGYAETAFSPLGSSTVRPAPPGGPIDTSRLYDLSLGVHIRVPVRERWAPYAILGGGVLWNAFNQSVAVPQSTAVVRHNTNFDFAFHTGGGVRYYIRENWGIRPEFEVVVSKQTYTRFSVGIFYVLPDPW
jgi:opacity protein-like surface antigen